MPETVHENGLMYLTRWYRNRPRWTCRSTPKLGGDLGFVKFLGDPRAVSGTLSITLAVRTAGGDLRTALSDPDRFDQACELLPGPDMASSSTRSPGWSPSGTVRPMTRPAQPPAPVHDGDGGAPVLGFHAIGDCHTCTNPLYGQELLAGRRAGHAPGRRHRRPPGRSGRAGGRTYEAACAAARWSPGTTRRPRWTAWAPTASGRGLTTGGGDGPAARRPWKPLFAAAATDPILGRARWPGRDEFPDPQPGPG